MNSVLKKVWHLFTPTERRKAVLMLVLCILMAFAETVGVLSIMPFLSVLARPEVIQENPWLREVYHYFAFEDFRAFILALGVVSIVTVVSSSAFKTVVLHMMNRFVHLERTSIASRLLARYLMQPYEFFLMRNAARLNKNLLSEVDMLIGNLLLPLSQMLAQGTIVLAVVTLIFLYDAVMALCIVIVVVALYGTIFGLVRSRLERIGRECQAAGGAYYQACSEALGGIKDVIITHSASAYQEKFHQASRLSSRHLASNDTLSQSPLYIVEAVGYSGLILVALWLVFKTNDVAHILPALGLYGFAAYRILPSAQIMYRGFARLRFSAAMLDNLVHDMNLPETPLPLAASMIVPQREIRLEKIRYAYPSTPDTPVFDSFDLVIEANSSVGFVGKSGGGKSTLMDILLGLLPPQSGVLSVDGVPIRGERILEWQAAIGYVPQHIFLSDASVWENIAFGIPPAEVDRDAVERAARTAQIHDFIMNDLREGYETQIGDRGIRLSGGQRQRIGIARALYRDPPVLFMDEATSALDSQTEEAVNQAIRALSGRKTIVVIAHREKSLQYCHSLVSI